MNTESREYPQVSTHPWQQFTAIEIGANSADVNQFNDILLTTSKRSDEKRTDIFRGG